MSVNNKEKRRLKGMKKKLLPMGITVMVLFSVSFCAMNAVGTAGAAKLPIMKGS